MSTCWPAVAGPAPGGLAYGLDETFGCGYVRRAGASPGAGRRASRVQEASRGRIAHHHLPDGPEQVARDAAFAGEDPLSHNDWLYGYDAELAAAAAAPAG